MTDDDAPYVETELADLRSISLADLADPTRQPDLTGYRADMHAQLARNRSNIGSGPPGRAD